MDRIFYVQQVWIMTRRKIVFSLVGGEILPQVEYVKHLVLLFTWDGWMDA